MYIGALICSIHSFQVPCDTFQSASTLIFHQDHHHLVQMHSMTLPDGQILPGQSAAGDEINKGGRQTEQSKWAAGALKVDVMG